MRLRRVVCFFTLDVAEFFESTFGEQGIARGFGGYFIRDASVLFFAEFETQEVEIEAGPLLFELRAPLFLRELILLEIAQIGDSAGETAFSGGAIAIKFDDIEEAVVGRLVTGGGFGADVEFAAERDALTTPEDPASDDGVGDNGGIVGLAGSVGFKRFGEELKKFLRIFAGEKHGTGGAAVSEVVETGESGTREGHGRCVVGVVIYGRLVVNW